MWMRGRRARETPIVPVAVEPLPPPRHRLWLPGLGGTLLHRRRRDAMPIPDCSEVDNLLMPDWVEDWPNFIVGASFRPCLLPGWVEDSDRNETLNMNKQNLIALLPDGQPRQPREDDAAVGGAADEGLGDDHGVVRSDSARVLMAKESQHPLVPSRDAETLAAHKLESDFRRGVTH
mmetsp:Transcript_99128/g.196467  ORF Transcript_99128/g.196467 Transcript_99128/m.196467 type:complete len:176 (+) Transcript_99128:32-559(+)